VVRGRVALALDPAALRRLAQGRRSVIVTGTNGKSTTTRLVTAALGGVVATNATGANMGPGVLTALDDSAAELAVLEVDELHVPSVMAQTHPQVLVALNLTRDQLDRTHEVSRIARLWAGSLQQRPQTVVVANAGDPHVADAAAAGTPVWVDPGLRWTEDASVCPRCGSVLDWADGGRWSCGCGFAMPRADYVATETGVRLPDGRELPLQLRLPGAVNRGNAAFAIAVAVAMGVEAEVAAVRLAAVEVVDGRYATLDLGGRTAQLLLAKNPAGWAAALSMIEGNVVAVGINARIADGTDTSWLYDVPFERLAGRVVGAFGDRRSDLAVRLHYAGATPVVSADPVELAAALPPGPLVMAANYTAFRELRRFVVEEPS
jgi:UDP-N-acetylmuramyl tripeptide synthase